MLLRHRLAAGAILGALVSRPRPLYGPAGLLLVFHYAIPIFFPAVAAARPAGRMHNREKHNPRTEICRVGLGKPTGPEAGRL